MKINKIIRLFIAISIAVAIFSCSSDSNKKDEYDPNKPVTVSKFFPQTGGMASKLVIEGNNFGSDPSSIKVFFNQKEAAVVSVENERIYLLVPRLPGKDCVIKVQIGTQEVEFEDTFSYIEKYAVTTIAGQPGTSEFKEGTLATAQFGDLQYVSVDKENNVFLAQRKDAGPAVCAVLNEATGLVTYLFTGTDNLNVPTVNTQTQVVYVPLDAGDTFYELNPANQWIAKTRLIQHPSSEQQAAGMVDFRSIDWKHSFAFSDYDNMIYTRAYRGDLIKIDPETRVGQLVASNLESGDSYLVAHPLRPEILYIAYTQRHCIYTYNLATNEHLLFAGAPGQPGWSDGRVSDAEFNLPRQMTLDLEGNLYIADEGNHCIRMIDKDGIVTTPIGQPGQEGYMDGSPEIALFKKPRGVAVDKNGDVYIADYGNRCLRKLTLQ
ncbi:IPT/TIG domain-containing protein [Dysgonomonas gadei]|uniref:IPT/TIG domain-containing protein n=1 Tax=Dysgonomonas gadei ATCC BAA-286 TaxID=742766 RepID=F5J2A3_9BACT|nr:IPT/TIG domain-containing protein [Dysgonomonas gadei]EGK00223.1 hypothetical protein HMPREF9455_03362 [Dysgonomonas gadei ATCC BAA-286]